MKMIIAAENDCGRTKGPKRHKETCSGGKKLHSCLTPFVLAAVPFVRDSREKWASSIRLSRSFEANESDTVPNSKWNPLL